MSKLTPILFIFYFTNCYRFIRILLSVRYTLTYLMLAQKCLFTRNSGNILDTVVYLQYYAQPTRDSLLFTFQVLTMFSIQKLLNYYICSHFHNYIDGCKHNQPMVAKIVRKQ